MSSQGCESRFLQRFRDFAAPIIDGHEFVRAAQRLEGLVINELPEGVEEDDLLESLALYAPGSGREYVQREELRRIVGAALARLEGRRV